MKSMPKLYNSIKPYVYNHEASIFNILSKEAILVGSLDNNQRVHCKKHQLNGISIKLVKVTGRFYLKFTPVPDWVVYPEK